MQDEFRKGRLFTHFAEGLRQFIACRYVLAFEIPAESMFCVSKKKCHSCFLENLAAWQPDGEWNEKVKSFSQVSEARPLNSEG